MNHKLFTTLSGLSISSTLLVIGLMAMAQAPRLPGVADDSQLVESLEADAIQATEQMAAPAGRRHRRGRALSMPYFSFAQSLRPQG